MSATIAEFKPTKSELFDGKCVEPFLSMQLKAYCISSVDSFYVLAFAPLL